MTTTKTPLVCSLLFSSVLFCSVSVLTGCFEDPCLKDPQIACEVNDEVGDGDGDGETGTVAGEELSGILWCGETASTSPGPAEAYFKNGPQPRNKPIWEDPVAGVGQPRACRCAHETLDDFLDQLDGNNNPLQILTSTQEDWEEGNNAGEGPLTFRNKIWGSVKERCQELAEAQWPNANDDPPNNCETAIDEDEFGGVTPIVRTEESCTPLMQYGSGGDMVPMPADSWSDYFTLREVITYYPSYDFYGIQGGFFSALLQTPAWLIGDDAFIAPNPTSGEYQFYNVTSGTIVDALGIQTGDIPQTLNDIDVSTIEGAIEAWEELQSEVTFELVVLRGTSLVTLQYDVLYI